MGDSFVKLEDLASNIMLLAVVNIAAACMGGLCNLGQAYLQATDKKKQALSYVALILLLFEAIVSVLELIVGIVSFLTNTQPFRDELNAIERAALGMEGSEEPQVCFSRNLDLGPTTPTGLPWVWSKHVFWALPAFIMTCLLSAFWLSLYRMPRIEKKAARGELGQVDPRTPNVMVKAATSIV